MTYNQLKRLKAECSGRCYTECSRHNRMRCDFLDNRQDMILGTVKKAKAWKIKDMSMLADSGVTNAEEEMPQ